MEPVSFTMFLGVSGFIVGCAVVESVLEKKDEDKANSFRMVSHLTIGGAVVYIAVKCIKGVASAFNLM